MTKLQRVIIKDRIESLRDVYRQCQSDKPRDRKARVNLLSCIRDLHNELNSTFIN